MDELQRIFDFQGQQVRMVIHDEEPWFIASDVCKILDIKNVTQALQRLEENERSMFNIGRQGNANIVSESGLYELIFASRKPEAKMFKKWVKQEVLPSIRKHGAYATTQTIDQILNDPDFGIKLLTTLKQERDEKAALMIESKAKDDVIKDLKPKADYTEMILKNKGLVTVNQIAKDYGMTAREMNKVLHNLKVQYKQGNQWLLYRKYDDEGYVHSETIPITRSDGRADITMTTKWTQKGRLFIYELLKAKGIIPVIEQDYTNKMVSAK
ncbi:phage antirepressor [Metabacillus bambusae]|uniref:Phage antirepressor n=1 Tax=Metabacillus bambusae TaxID=2795218 RepID=A0ABS3N4N0_9BACI|nr:phage antirepressor [Metabacillus bambusae]MBO1513227.1 phage antirepressor [Metabacillus bambusae]